MLQLRIARDPQGHKLVTTSAGVGNDNVLCSLTWTVAMRSSTRSRSTRSQSSHLVIHLRCYAFVAMQIQSARWGMSAKNSGLTMMETS